MKTAGEIIDALHLAGATLVIEGGRARMTGATVPDELKALVKSNRESVIAEWTRRQFQNLDRYAEVPPGDAARSGRFAKITKQQADSVTAYAFRQPRPVHAWVTGRTNEYFLQGVALGDDEICACIDLLCWQRNGGHKEAVEWLAGLDGSTARMKPL